MNKEVHSHEQMHLDEQAAAEGPCQIQQTLGGFVRFSLVVQCNRIFEKR